MNNGLIGAVSALAIASVMAVYACGSSGGGAAEDGDFAGGAGKGGAQASGGSSGTTAPADCPASSPCGGGGTSGVTGGSVAGGTSGSATDGASGSATGGTTSSAAGGSTTGTTGGSGGTSTGDSTSGTGGTATAGANSTGGAAAKGPCDLFAAANTACVAAHSTIRTLLASYGGPLYRVKRASDSTFKDIGARGGFADSEAQDAFCSGTTCTITRLFDQSGHGNYLEAETSDAEDPSVRPAPTSMNHAAASATKESLTVGGHKVYSLYLTQTTSYWRDGSKSGMPLGSAPQSIYLVTSGTHVNGGCCNDYGNSEVARKSCGPGCMDALYFGTSTGSGTGNGSGPWVMADLESAAFAEGDRNKNNNSPSMTYKYVHAVEKNNGTSKFALKGSDATTGKLTTFYNGALPSQRSPMKKQGAIVLGSGGDCCYSNISGSQGTFYEGAITAGYPPDATDDAVHANIVNAGYGQ